MSKEVRVCLSLIQIALMLLSVVSFSAILNSGVVSGQGGVDEDALDDFFPNKDDYFSDEGNLDDKDEGPGNLGNTNQPTSTLGLEERLFYFAEDVKDGEYGSFWSLTIGGGTALDAVASAASYAAAAYASIKLFTEIFGIEGKKARNIERAAVIGVGT